MTYQLTIVGLGEIGTSLGMALSAQSSQLTRVGCDLLKSNERRALDEFKAVDKTIHNIYEAVRDADIIVLAIPSDETQKTLELIGQDVKDTAVIMDFSPSKKSAYAWAKKYLKDPTHFIGLWGEYNPRLLKTPGNRMDSANAELFKDGALFICPAADTDKDVIQNAGAIAQMLDAYTCYCDMDELDGLTAATFNAPYVLHAALFSAVAHSTGWTEAQKSAGRSFALGTSLLNTALDETDQSFTLMQNRENTVRAINNYVAELKKYRDALMNMDEAGLNQMMKTALDERDKWLAQCKTGAFYQESRPKIPENVSAAESYNQMLFGNLFRRKKKD